MPTGRMRVGWSGQASLNVARDPDMLAMMKRCGCQGLILGLESPNLASLQEGNKTWIDPSDYIPLIRRIQEARRVSFGLCHRSATCRRRQATR